MVGLGLRHPAAATRPRIRVFVVFMAVIASLAAGRALEIQGVDAAGAAHQAAAMMSNTRPLSPMRGTIYDRQGLILAQTLPSVRLTADPDGISRNGVAAGQKLSASQQKKAAAAPEALADILMTYLGGSINDYLPHLLNTVRADGKRNQYEVIATNVPSYTYAKIRADMVAGGWYGLFSEDTPIRSYPDGALASNALGFVGVDGQGLDGFELWADGALTGVPGTENYEAAAYGRIPLADDTLVPAIDGDSYWLTLDAGLQKIADQELAAAVASSGATWGIAIAMDVKTGQVLALSNVPTFNANAFASSTPAQQRDRAVTDAYEPGSVQKVLTMAALVDAGIVTPDTAVEVPASIESGGSRITDSFSHGTLYLTARGVLANSSNVGMALLTRQLDTATLVTYLRSFGLGAPTGIQLPGESSAGMGDVPDATMPGYQRDRVAFGQSISVTALQEAAAVAAIADGGVYHAPTLIESVTAPDGTIRPVAAVPPHQVVSPATSTAVLNMMESVIAAPQYAGTRSIPGYRVAGKSGTAQRVDPRTNQYSGYTASFVMVAPVEDPQILVYVVLDQPVNGHQGSEVALPPAKDIMTAALPRYGILPSADVPAYTDPLTYQP